MSQEQSPIITHIRNLQNSVPNLDIEKAVHLEKEIIENENTYQSCCLRVDKRALSFFSSLAVSLIVLLFSIYQLINKNKCEDIQIYISLITMVVGIFLPQPNLNNDKK